MSPLWAWGPRMQWLVCVVVVLACFLISWKWLEHHKTAWLQSRLQATSTQLQLSEYRQKTSRYLQDIPAGPGTTAEVVSSLSATLAGQAEQSGLRVLRWSSMPPTQVGSALNKSLRKADLLVNLQGPYASIKSWMSQALQEQPWLALESMQWRLSDVGSGVLEAQIKWNVYVAE